VYILSLAAIHLTTEVVSVLAFINKRHNSNYKEKVSRLLQQIGSL
jgi:hypothetical protein